MSSPRYVHPLQDAQRTMGYLAFAVGAVLGFALQLAAHVERARRLELARRRELGALVEHVDELGAALVPLLAKRDSWERLGAADRRAVMRELAADVKRMTDAGAQLQLQPATPDGPVYQASVDAPRGHPLWLRNCDCPTPPACVTEGTCRRQLPEPADRPPATRGAPGGCAPDDVVRGFNDAERQPIIDSATGAALGYTTPDDA